MGLIYRKPILIRLQNKQDLNSRPKSTKFDYTKKRSVMANKRIIIKPDESKARNSKLFKM